MMSVWLNLSIGKICLRTSPSNFLGHLPHQLYPVNDRLSWTFVPSNSPKVIHADRILFLIFPKYRQYISNPYPSQVTIADCGGSGFERIGFQSQPSANCRCPRDIVLIIHVIDMMSIPGINTFSNNNWDRILATEF